MATLLLPFLVQAEHTRKAKAKTSGDKGGQRVPGTGGRGGDSADAACFLPDSVAEEGLTRDTALSEVIFPSSGFASESSDRNTGILDQGDPIEVHTSGEDSSTRSLRLWAEGFGESAAAFELMLGQKHISPGGGDWPLELSLVLTKTKVVPSASAGPIVANPSEREHQEHECGIAFVAWRLPGKTGRMIEVDANNCLIATNPTCQAFDLQEGNRHEGSEILLPATGAWAHKSRRADRPPVPPPALRLKQMFETALSHQCGTDDHLSLESCFVCGEGALGGEAAEEVEITEAKPISLCPFCLRSLHFTCASSDKYVGLPRSDFVSALDGVVENARLVSVQQGLHPLFSGTCCHFCKAALSS